MRAIRREGRTAPRVRSEATLLPLLRSARLTTASHTAAGTQDLRQEAVGATEWCQGVEGAERKMGEVGQIRLPDRGADAGNPFTSGDLDIGHMGQRPVQGAYPFVIMTM